MSEFALRAELGALTAGDSETRAKARYVILTVLRAVDRGIVLTSLVVASFALTAALAVGSFQVLARFVLHVPAPWSEAALRIALVWSIFAALPLAVRRGALLSVDLLDRTLAGTRWQLWIRVAVACGTAAVLVVLVLGGYALAVRLAFQTLPGLGMSVAYAYAAIPVGSALAIPSLVAALLMPANTPVTVEWAAERP